MADKNKEKIKDIIEQTKEKVEPQLKKAMKKAEPQLKKAMEKAEPQLKKAKEKAKPYIDKVEPQIKKAKKKAEPVVKEAVDKVRRATTRTELFLQYHDYEMRMEDIIDKVREDYLRDGKGENALKSLRIYIKPEEHAAYYVANGHDTGKVIL